VGFLFSGAVWALRTAGLVLDWGKNLDHPITRPRIDSRRVRFRETDAFRRFGANANPEPTSPEDLYTKAILREQGFDGLPQVVSREEVDGYVAAGEIEVFRGLSDRRYADQLRFGELFVGRGSLGGGIYTAGGGPDAFQLATDLAEGQDAVVVRMSIKERAQVGDADELAALALETRARELGRLDAELAQAIQRATRQARSALIPGIEVEFGLRRAAVEAEYTNLGRYAAYLGYDVVHERESGYYLVLNRTCLRIQEEDIQ
jgi:hypothetical protein